MLFPAMIDNQLGLWLREQMVAGKVADELFFVDRAPLSSFSSRISAVFAFGMIDQAMYTDLDAVRRFRNRFAHHPANMTFQDQKVTDLVKNLSVYQEILAGVPIGGHRKIARVTISMMCVKLTADISAGLNRPDA